MHLLVIGASGYIGSEIYNEAVYRGVDVIGTKCNSKNSKLYQLDISKSNYELPYFQKGKKYAIICSADSCIDSVYTHKEKAYYKNVTATINLIEKLRNHNYKVIFLSSDNVFDGVKGNYTEEEAQNPINEYGKMKAEVEKYMLNSRSNDCIMRIGKTVGTFTKDSDMLMDWYKKAVQGKNIYCIKDNILTPIYVKDIVQSFFAVMEQDLKGLYNVVSDVAYSRTELCRQFFKTIKLEADIYEKDVAEFGFKDKRPLKVSLSNGKFVSDTGTKFKRMEDIFERFSQEIM